ncbi:hypothetical protein [Nonomuraea sp. LPB2021202275-12-8]|uniref:hypothetical protein n=1 Tax=Nonomuraea sp. LPB2021202275-12-8 TaxID=3120159 RepID=UPI00300D2F84
MTAKGLETSPGPFAAADQTPGSARDAAAISATLAAPAQALPPWYVDDDIVQNVDTNRVYYEDGRPYVVSYCWSYEWGLTPCGRYL